MPRAFAPRLIRCHVWAQNSLEVSLYMGSGVAVMCSIDCAARSNLAQNVRKAAVDGRMDTVWPWDALLACLSPLALLSSPLAFLLGRKEGGEI